MWQDMQRDSQPAVFTALFAAKWAEIKALWWLRCSAPLVSLHRPFAQVDESFRKPQPPLCVPPLHPKKKLSGKMQQGTETPQRLTLNPLSRSKRITNWISMWYIHYCEILCCSPLKAHHPPLPSLAHTPGPSTQTPAPPAPHRKTAYAGSSQLG